MVKTLKSLKLASILFLLFALLCCGCSKKTDDSAANQNATAQADPKAADAKASDTAAALEKIKKTINLQDGMTFMEEGTQKITINSGEDEDGEDLEGEEKTCITFAYGTDHPDQFVAEERYAVCPDGLVYEYDIIVDAYVKYKK